MGFTFTEYRDQNVGAVYFFFTGRLYVKHGALQDALEPQSRLRFPLVVFRQQGRIFLDELGQIIVQAVQVRAACAQNFRRGRIIE